MSLHMVGSRPTVVLSFSSPSLTKTKGISAAMPNKHALVLYGAVCMLATNQRKASPIASNVGCGY